MADSLREPLLGLKPRGRLPSAAVDTSVESLSYNPPTNKLRVQQHKLEGQERRHVYGYTGHTAVARVSTIVAGVLIGVTAVAIQSSIEHLVLLRNGLLQSLFSNGALGTGQAVATWAGISVAAVVFSGALVQLFAPKAAGAGVTLVMAFLNGNDIRGLLNLPVFVIKIVGLVCSRVAGLAVGPEGPMVHLGACIASMVYEWEPWFMRRAATEGVAAGQQGRQGGRSSRAGSSLPHSSPEGATEGAAAAVAGGSGAPDFRAAFKNADHRELVSAGAAAGIAAAFGAPIGGVLFSLEEAATHWSRKVGWRCFLCTTCASFTLAQLHPRSQSGMLPFKSNSPLTNEQWLMQAPFIIIVSACGGLLGAAFNVLRKKLWPIRASRRRTVLRLAEAAGVALATVGLTAGLALYFGSCLPLPESWLPHHGVRLTCPPGHYNDLGTMLLGSDVWVIRTLLNLGGDDMPVHKSCSLWSPCYFSWPSLALLSASYLLLMALASSLCLPGGLFMPSIISGGAFGALFGFFLRRVLPAAWDIQPGVYALLCATAVLGGVFRSTFSLVVIVVEGTRGIDFLFGIILSILFSNLVASRVLPDGVYESELERDGQLYYLRPEAPWALRSKTAEDMMATPVAGLEALVPVQGVRSLLAATTHNGFPVYASGEPRDPATGMGRLVGFVTRSQLEVMLRHKAYSTAAGEYASVPPADVAAYEAQLNFEMRQAQATVVMLPALPWQPPLPHAQSSAAPSRAASGRRSARWRPLLGAPGSGLQRGEWGGSQASLAGALVASRQRELEEGMLPGDRAEEPAAGGDGEATIRTLEEAAAAAGVLAAAAAAAAGSSAALPRQPNGLEAAGSSWGGAGGTTAATAVSAVSVMGASASEDGFYCDDDASAAGLFLNLAPFMDVAPLVVRPECLGTVAHHLFLAMSMRHLLVVNDRMVVVGIITRKDLDHAAGEGWWRINKIAPHPHHETGLRWHQSWLAYSLAAPRRLLSAVQRVVSPVASPRASRRGTPAASPGGTPPASRLGTPTGTPRASDLEAGSAAGVFGGGGGGGGGDSSSSGRSSFWSPDASSGGELMLGGSSTTDSEVVAAVAAAAADGGLVAAAAASTASASRGFADFMAMAAHSGEEVEQQQQQKQGYEAASMGSAPSHVATQEGEGQAGGSSPVATPQSSRQHPQPRSSGEEGEEPPPGTSPLIHHAGMPIIEEEREGQQAEQGQAQGEGAGSRAGTLSPGHSSSGSGGGTPGRAPRRVRIIGDDKRQSNKLQSFGSLVHPEEEGHGGS